MNNKLQKVIISGGGTGGHIFPAIAIADQIKRENPNVEILFVGAEGKMEMEKVPKAGYKIKALPIVGLQRKLTVKNLLLPLKLIKSLLLARKIIRSFRPDVVVGVGGYASGPLLKMASSLNIPCLIQEQNSFAGKTNKLLAKGAKAICVAYENMETFFPKEKIILTGNPVRLETTQIEGKREESFQFFKLDPNKKTILVIGGSLGARTLNESMEKDFALLTQNSVQVIWQCGGYYYAELKEKLQNTLPKGVILTDFIQRMDYAYAASDLVISRAGAISVSELCLVGKPTILVPSPNVAEDHQTKNAMALVQKDAAVLVRDAEAKESLIPTVIELLSDGEKQTTLAQNIRTLGKPNATKEIVSTLYSILS